jgi:hypothetical protein
VTPQTICTDLLPTHNSTTGVNIPCIVASVHAATFLPVLALHNQAAAAAEWFLP